MNEEKEKEQEKETRDKLNTWANSVSDCFAHDDKLTAIKSMLTIIVELSVQVDNLKKNQNVS